MVDLRPVFEGVFKARCWLRTIPRAEQLNCSLCSPRLFQLSCFRLEGTFFLLLFQPRITVHSHKKKCKKTSPAIAIPFAKSAYPMFETVESARAVSSRVQPCRALNRWLVSCRFLFFGCFRSESSNLILFPWFCLQLFCAKDQ